MERAPGNLGRKLRSLRARSSVTTLWWKPDRLKVRRKMNQQIQELVSTAKRLARSGDEEGAMSLANRVVEQYPNEFMGWSLRAYLNGLNRNFEGAVLDLTRAIEKHPSMPGDLSLIDLYLNRGTERFVLGDHRLAVDDFTMG